MFEKLRTKRLCTLVSKELAEKGYLAWRIDNSNSDHPFNLGVTLPDEVRKQPDVEMKKFNNAVIEVKKKYPQASIYYQGPAFSAGGVYAMYLEIKRI